MAMRRLGVEKWRPKPKTPEQWDAVYRKYKFEIPNVDKIDTLKLNWSSYGKGQSGLRYFKYYKLPVITYFHPTIKIVKNKTKDEVVPSLEILLKNGVTKQITAKNLQEGDILEKFQNIMKD